MRSRLKKAAVVLWVLLTSLMMCFSAILLIPGKTVFNADYVKQELHDKQIYYSVCDEVRSAVKSTYLKSDFRNEKLDPWIDELLDTVILPALLQKECEDIIDQLYSGEPVRINSTYFVEDYSQSITDFLNSKNISVEKESVQKLIQTVADTVDENIDLSEYGTKATETFMALQASVRLTYIICIVLTVLLCVPIVILSADKWYTLRLPFYIAGCMLILLSFVVLAVPGNVHILNDNLSELFNTLFLWVAILMIFYALTNIIVGIIVSQITTRIADRRFLKKALKTIDTTEVIRLMSKRRKGLLRLVFSRIGIVLLLMWLQLNVLMSVYNWFSEYFKWFGLAQAVFTIAMVFYLFSNTMDASAKLTWLFLIMLFPVPATIMLFYTQMNIGHRLEKKRVEELIGATKDKLTQDENTIAKSELVESGTDDLCRYLNRSGCFPIYENTQVTYFPLGEDKFAAMLDELKKAESFIFMEYFIIDEGLMWGSILRILADKVKEGVDVRVMYDGMCEMSTLTADYPKRLEKLGIKCKPFSPIRPFISTHYNYRDHRKILVIDGKVAFNGGVNLADEYINHIERFGHWKDTALMLRGEAVQSFTLMFLQMWNMVEPNVKWDECEVKSSAETDGYVMPYCDCPLDGDKVGESVYIDILYRAKSYVHIMTPYLILDNELETALKFAAQRGVDVKLILPGIPDKKEAYSLAKTHYRSLVSAGVKIYEYTPGFVHAKVFVSDDEKAVVGTINLDYRSLYHHFECATYLYRAGCITKIEEDFSTTLVKCKEVTPDTIKHEKLSYKIRGGFMKMIAPLM